MNGLEWRSMKCFGCGAVPIGTAAHIPVCEACFSAYDAEAKALVDYRQLTNMRVRPFYERLIRNYEHSSIWLPLVGKTV